VSVKKTKSINMKKNILILISSVSLVSCATGPNAQTGSVIGALAGAGVGGIIGSQSGRGLEGAAIGAGLGALGGNAIGNSRDQQNANSQQGYYDRNGRWHPQQQQQQQQQGYYDRQGNYRY
jgi:uncharacterized protein YcfJ